MASLETNGDAGGLRKGNGIPFKPILIVQNQKNTVILFQPSGAKILLRNSHPHLAQKDHALPFGAFQLTDGAFHIPKIADGQGCGHQDNAAGFQSSPDHRVKLGVLRILQLL